MKKRRSSFTLIEVIISFGLLTTLLSTLFFWYRHLSNEKRNLEKAKWPLIEERYAEERLTKILPKANLKPYFFSTTSDAAVIEGTSLVFTFDHGAAGTLDPLLSGNVLGRLYLDKKSRALYLTLWPGPQKGKRDTEHTMVLLNDLSALSFEFYYPPQMGKIVDPNEVGGPLKGWQNEWKQSYDTLPAMMKIHFERGGKQITWGYDLPYSPHSQITYPADKK